MKMELRCTFLFFIIIFIVQIVESKLLEYRHQNAISLPVLVLFQINNLPNNRCVYYPLILSQLFQ